MEWRYIKDYGYPDAAATKAYYVLYSTGEVSRTYWEISKYYDAKKDLWVPNISGWSSSTPDPDKIVAYAEPEDPDTVLEALQYIIKGAIK